MMPPCTGVVSLARGSKSVAQMASSEMSGLRRLGHPIVVSAVEETHWCTGALAVIGIVETSYVHSDIVAPDGLDVAALERADAAVTAKEMVHASTAELVID
jgi:hypothetical protein